MTFKKKHCLFFSSLVLIFVTIDFNALDNYLNRLIPFYILKYNMSTTNPITYKVTALGRVLFYDKKLSVDNSISCASCRKHELALDDTAHISLGVN